MPNACLPSGTWILCGREVHIKSVTISGANSKLNSFYFNLLHLPDRTNVNKLKNYVFDLFETIFDRLGLTTKISIILKLIKGRYLSSLIDFGLTGRAGYQNFSILIIRKMTAGEKNLCPLFSRSGCTKAMLEYFCKMSFATVLYCMIGSINLSSI